MSVFGLFAHISLLIHLGRDIQGIIANLVQKKESFPSKDEFISLIDDGISLITSGLISLPPDVVKVISDSLAGVKAELAKV